MTGSDRTFRIPAVRGPARNFYERASALEQQQLDVVFDALEADPYPDSETKFDFTRMIPVMLYAYADDDFRILYQLVSHDDPDWNDWEIDIWAITRV